MPDQSLDSEDAKIVTLARSARARSGRLQGAAVRDNDGRTYVATTVSLASLELSALQVAVAMAVSSEAPGLEAAAIVGTSTQLAGDDRALLRELGGPDLPVLLADPDGTVRELTRPG
jgi:cytidine deaminase